MAEKNVNYPFIPANRWWTVRKSFSRTIPKEVTDSYLSSILNIQQASARNIISPLKRTGLIDADGKPTDLARGWRDDGQYAGVCEEIRKKVYPSELLDAFPDATSPRTSVERWFANKTGLGDSAVGQMAAFYLLLDEADPTKQDDVPTAAKAQKPGSTISPEPRRAAIKSVQTKKEATNGAHAQMQLAAEEKPAAPYKAVPSVESSLYINIQIHISSDASVDQIDQIFASMAKHLPSLQR